MGQGASRNAPCGAAGQGGAIVVGTQMGQAVIARGQTVSCSGHLLGSGGQ